MTKKNLSIGFHTKISGGIEKCLSNLDSYCANAAQIFTKSNRQYFSNLPSQETVQAFKASQKELNFYDVFVHAGYLINMAGEGEVLEKSMKSLALEIELCALYGLKYLVLHPGSAGTKSIEKACQDSGKNIGQVVKQALKLFGNKCPTILLENMAGQGSSIGHTFEQLSSIRTWTGEKTHIGFCLDTAHLFAYGWNLRDKKEVARLTKEIEKTLSWDLVKLIHLNDSKEPCGQKKDRHENWPKGTISMNGLENIIGMIPEGIPLILETPENSDPMVHKDEIKLIRNLHTKLYGN